MKRALLAIAAAIVFISTVVVPTIVHADGVGGTSCGGGHNLCKP